MINLHALANPAIATVHPNEKLTLFISAGQVNNRGELTPLYHSPIVLEAQVQPYGERLEHSDETNDSGETCRAYVRSTLEHRPGSLLREFRRGGDLIRRDDGSYWLITGVLDEFTKSEWVCITIVRQTESTGYYPVIAEDIMEDEVYENEFEYPTG